MGLIFKQDRNLTDKITKNKLEKEKGREEDMPGIDGVQAEIITCASPFLWKKIYYIIWIGRM